jgi:hypothetical protein
MSSNRVPASGVPLNLVLALIAFGAGTAALVIVALLTINALD